MELKKCKACGVEKPKNKSFWYERNDSKDGFKNVCRECVKNNNKVNKKTPKEGCIICKKCGVEMLATNENFNKCAKGKYGLQSICKKCARENYKEYNLRNKEKIRIKNKEYEKNNSEKIKEKAKEYRKNNDDKAREYREKNKERLATYHREYAKKYRIENPEKIRENKRRYNNRNKEKAKLYRIKNKEIICIYSQKRRAKQKGLANTFNNKQWKEIKKKFEYKCAYCGLKYPLVQEHFIPLSKGGEYTINNIIPACQHCNSCKGTKDFEEWYSNYEYFSEERKENILNHLRDVNKNK